MLLRICQADAYAAATEYIRLPKEQYVQDQALQFAYYCKHPRYSFSAGSYTDDGQMSIAVSEVLLQGPPYTKRRFADAFVRCFLRDPRDGYSRGFQNILNSIQSTDEFLAAVVPNSIKNGAAMRAVPVGLLPTIPEVLDVAAIQAAVTHETDEGIYSAQMVAIMSHFCYRTNYPLHMLPDYLREHMPVQAKSGRKMPDWFLFLDKEDGMDYYPAQYWRGKVVAQNSIGIACATVWAVLSLLVLKKDLMSILKQTIEWGGDTDSVAAIAWGLASARMTEELPEFLLAGLESGSLYGASFLLDLGSQLQNKFLDNHEPLGV
jgi:ADP-ribosylglycohydrolase